jgi:oxaloacetate decarboxylase alpha subunit
MNKKPLGITELVLRDAHQSLFATRMRIEDMLPIAQQLDKVGYWSLETWGGATFDACIRYLGEDPWQRLRKLKAAMPNTRMQMLFRGQNILGYRHYADDVVEKFVERAAANGMDVFRIFDAMNDVRNLKTAVQATIKVGKHAQGTLSYTVSPVHTTQMWLDMAKALEDLGCHSICIKDMAGLLKPYVAEELVARLKETVTLPIAMQCHATTGLSTASIVKATEAGLDLVDTAISSMSMTYGHSATESVVSIFEGTDRDTGLNLKSLEKIATYFRNVRKKYTQFEGSLKGVDSRILLAQVPGGMLTNMENQLRQQNAVGKMDEVLAEIPRVRKDLGYIALVTPTSQIVGSQAVLNVLMGERYKTITKETADILKGNYGATPAPINAELQRQVLKAGEEATTCRPADLLKPEINRLTQELKKLATEKQIKLAGIEIEDVLTYALFPQVGLAFLQNRGNPDAFEPPPSAEQPPSKQLEPASAVASSAERYRVVVNGQAYDVEVGPGGAITQAVSAAAPAAASAVPAPPPVATAAPAQGGIPVPSPMAGRVVKLHVALGQKVAADELILTLEAMKMETPIHAPRAGTVASIPVQEGGEVAAGAPLITLA